GGGVYTGTDGASPGTAEPGTEDLRYCILPAQKKLSTDHGTDGLQLCAGEKLYPKRKTQSEDHPAENRNSTMKELKDIWQEEEGSGRLLEEQLLSYLEGRLPPEAQHEVERFLADEGLESDALE